MTDGGGEQVLSFSYAVRVRWELWESLLSMLRVYANAASLTHGEFVITALSDAAWMHHNGYLLSLQLDAENGIVSWAVKGPADVDDRRCFELLESGALLAAGQETELDRAAIDWVEELTKIAARKRALENKSLRTSQ
jgi:hypothetical protein